MRFPPIRNVLEEVKGVARDGKDTMMVQVMSIG